MQVAKPKKGYKLVKTSFGKYEEIPEEWTLTNLGNSCDILDSKRIPLNGSERMKIQGDIPYYGANGIQGYVNKHLFDQDLILVAEDGGNFTEYETKPIAYVIHGKSWVNNHAHILAPKKGYDLNWVFYSLVHKNIIPWVNGTTRSKLNQSELKKIEINSPQLPEQQKITSILSNVDDTLQKTNQIIEQTQRLKKGMMQKLLTRGIGHSKFKKTKIGEIPEEWEAKLLDDVTVRGSGHTPNKMKPEYWNGGIKWVSLSDSNKLDNVFISETAKQISEQGIQHSSAVKHPEGTVILSRDAGIGKSAILSSEMAISQHFMTWECKEKLNNFFLYYLLQLWKPKFERIAVGATIPTIGLPYFKKMMIPLPPLPEQKQISSILSNVDTQIQKEKLHKSNLERLKKGLMQKLLTGQIRVKIK